MKSFAKKLLARKDAAFRRSGSVLIIVIVLLLLLAILGAAYISTTRSSRVASAQNVLSSDVDTALNGINQVCQGIITDDLNDTFGNLRGNTAYVINPTPTNPLTYRSVYQGITGALPPIAPSVPLIGPTPPAWSYNPGDIANDAANPPIFYSLQGNAPVVVTTDIAPSTTPGTGWQLLTGHLPFTAMGSDSYLADRIPIPDNAGNPTWQYLTQSVQVSTANPNGAAMSIIGTPFEDPMTGAILTTSQLPGPLLGGNTVTPAPIYPTFKTLSNGTNVPALAYATPPRTFVAGDADGDGIPDSFLFPLPGMNLDGLTWFAAVRIIDNNSAINVNTAWSRDQDFIYSGSPAVPTNIPNTWGLFQTSVGLQELVNVGDTTGAATSPTYLNLNTYRFNNAGSVASQIPYDESPIGGNIAPNAFSRGAGGSADYNFLTEGEAFYQQLIRRIANPGYNTYTAGSPSAGRYQAFSLADEAALAYHFGLPNSSSSNPQTLLETLLPNSLFWKTAPAGPTAGVPYINTPYDPSQALAWYNANFAYPTGSDNVNGLPLRALLVTRNPVSNYIQQVYNNNTNNPGGPGIYSSSDPLLPNYMLPYGANTATPPTNPHYRGAYSSGINYNLNDIILFPAPGTVAAPSYTFIEVNPTGAIGVPPATFTNGVMTSVNTLSWQLQPWSSNPVKANINTATFQELFRAFWCVMAGNPSNATPFGYTTDDASATPSIYDATPANPQLMFRSPLRDPLSATPGVASELDVPAAAQASKTTTSTNTMLLRAALAAVNTLGLRDNSQNIISRTILLLNPSLIDTGATGAQQTPVELQVFSNAPQPVISEVYANTFTGPDSNTAASNPQGYVAVELYNPYPVTLTLRNWQLGLINRNTAGSNYPHLNFQTFPPTPIPANPTANPQPPVNSVSIIGPMYPLNDPTVPGLATPPPVGYYPTVKIPPHGYALLENYNGSTAAGTPKTSDDAMGRPVNASAVASIAPPVPGSFSTAAALVQQGIWYGPNGPGTVALPANTCDVYVPNLQLVIAGTAGTTTTGASITALSTGGELVLLRPRQISGAYTQSTASNNVFNEGTTDPSLNVTTVNLWDLVPVDSYDFSGLTMPGAASYPVWSYVREKGSAPQTWFKQFFPGIYDATVTPMPRESPNLGTEQNQIILGNQNPIWNNPHADPSFGYDANFASYSNSFPPIQVYNANSNLANAAQDVMHFPNAVVSPQSPYPTGIVPGAGKTYLLPLGGFARNGDMLDVPFIGAYRIRIAQGAFSQLSSQYFLEMNALPKDCSMAAVETNLQPQDLAENIGRFMPMAASNSYFTLFHSTTPPPTPLPDYSAWTRSLFNYLTVQSSSDAYLPNFDPNYASSTANPSFFAYPVQNNATGAVPPTPTLTADATASSQTAQDSVGIEGLININTASWKVLSMLPMITQNESATWLVDNQNLAKAIVAWRNAHGPFTSIYDLNSVVDLATSTATVTNGFQNAEGHLTLTNGGNTGGVSSLNGILSPPDPLFPKVTNPPIFPTATMPPGTASATGVSEDYQTDCAILTRISNLITTRSDTFTIYIELQGWQNVGTANAQPVVTRRFANIVDRSAINADPSSRYLKTLTVPND